MAVFATGLPCFVFALHNRCKWFGFVFHYLAMVCTRVGRDVGLPVSGLDTDFDLLVTKRRIIGIREPLLCSVCCFYYSILLT
jgi:hypothetical protein